MAHTKLVVSVLMGKRCTVTWNQVPCPEYILSFLGSIWLLLTKRVHDHRLRCKYEVKVKANICLKVMLWAYFLSPLSFLVYLCSYFNQWVTLSTGKCRQWFLTQFLIQKLRSTDSPLKDIRYRKASPYYPALFFSPWTGVQSHWNKSLDWACNCVKKLCNVDLSISLLMATLPRLFEINKICLAF